MVCFVFFLFCLFVIFNLPFFQSSLPFGTPSHIHIVWCSYFFVLSYCILLLFQLILCGWQPVGSLAPVRARLHFATHTKYFSKIRFCTIMRLAIYSNTHVSVGILYFLRSVKPKPRPRLGSTNVDVDVRSRSKRLPHWFIFIFVSVHGLVASVIMNSIYVRMLHFESWLCKFQSQVKCQIANCALHCEHKLARMRSLHCDTR